MNRNPHKAGMNATEAGTVTVGGLQEVNAELAQLTRREPLALSFGSDRAAADQLWVWGVVGGKDVGKTTLANALAGGNVIDPGVDIGEGTAVPNIYMCPADEAAWQSRSTGIEIGRSVLCAQAPDSMRGLVLVDLPDFDSSFDSHAERVAAFAPMLDGLIWVTTPRKVDDLRGVREMDRVLKDRGNFVYVINKMDWLLGQSDESPETAMSRVHAAVARQIEGIHDSAAVRDRIYLVAARHSDADAMNRSIERHRGGGVHVADDSAIILCESMARLRRRLIEPPNAVEALHRKQANAVYELRQQANRIEEYYAPRRLLDDIAQIESCSSTATTVNEALPPAYCGRVMARLNRGRDLFAEWSTALFRARVSHWPLLGFVAWPATMVLSFLSRKSGVAATASSEDFVADGLPLSMRIDHLIQQWSADRVSLMRRIAVEAPNRETLEESFRLRASLLADEMRDNAISPLMRDEPGVIGRAIRTMLVAILLLWFPLVQPVLHALLGDDGATLGLNRTTAARLVAVLSAGNILAGLGASLLSLMVVVAAIYSGAARAATRLVARVQSAEPAALAAEMTTPLIVTIDGPVRNAETRLKHAITTLNSAKAPSTPAA